MGALATNGRFRSSLLARSFARRKLLGFFRRSRCFRLTSRRKFLRFLRRRRRLARLLSWRRVVGRRNFGLSLLLVVHRLPLQIVGALLQTARRQPTDKAFACPHTWVGKHMLPPFPAMYSPEREHSSTQCVAFVCTQTRVSADSGRDSVYTTCRHLRGPHEGVTKA